VCVCVCVCVVFLSTESNLLFGSTPKRHVSLENSSYYTLFKEHGVSWFLQCCIHVLLLSRRGTPFRVQGRSYGPRVPSVLAARRQRHVCVRGGMVQILLQVELHRGVDQVGRRQHQRLRGVRYAGIDASSNGVCEKNVLSVFQTCGTFEYGGNEMQTPKEAMDRVLIQTNPFISLQPTSCRV